MPVKTQHVVDKFCESFWKLSVYGTLLSLGVHALHDQPWLTQSASFWSDWPVEALPCALPLSQHNPHSSCDRLHESHVHVLAQPRHARTAMQGEACIGTVADGELLRASHGLLLLGPIMSAGAETAGFGIASEP